MNTRLLSELFILSLCVVFSLSTRSRSRNPTVSDHQDNNNNAQRRQQQQFQQPPVQPSSAHQTDSVSKLTDQWQSSGDDDVDLEQSGEGRQDKLDDNEDEDDDNEDGINNGYDDDDEVGINNGYDDEDEDGTSGDDDLVDIPTTIPLLTRCKNMSNSRPSFPSAFRPQCTATGAFMPMQCHQITGECWCVDSDGNQLGNVYRAPMRPDCNPTSVGEWTRAPILPTQSTDDIDIDNWKTSVQPSADIRPPDDIDDGENPGVEPVPPKTWYEYILHHPLLLTAVIAGSVLFLVILVLMLMFCVYRMRKKDEGSYSLDEPRQTFNYTRAKDQEFFA